MIDLLCLGFRLFDGAGPDNTWTRLDKAASTADAGTCRSATRRTKSGSSSSAAAPSGPTTRSRVPTTCSPSTPSRPVGERVPAARTGGRSPALAARRRGRANVGLRDAEGNVRPNWTVYGTFSLGQKYDYDPDTKAFFFYAGGRTFRYDPAEADVDRPRPEDRPGEGAGRHPAVGVDVLRPAQQALRPLRRRQRAEPNAATPAPGRTRPPTTPGRSSSSTDQPPQRANSRLVYDPGRTRRSSCSAATSSTSSWPTPGRSTWSPEVGAEEAEPSARRRAPGTPCSGCRRRRRSCCWAATATPRRPVTSRACTGRCRWKRGPTTSPPTAGSCIKRFEPAKDAPVGPANFFLQRGRGRRRHRRARRANGTWLVPARREQARRRRHGRSTASKPAPSTAARGPHDPAWYREDVPAADPAKVDADLEELPANRWVLRPTPKLPRPNMDWGSAVFAPELDQILRFSGGHSAYSGTAPQVYDVKTDRYSIPFAPEYPDRVRLQQRPGATASGASRATRG